MAADGPQTTLGDIVQAVHIQPIEVLERVKDQFGLEKDIRQGFLWLQFERISRCFRSITFQRIKDLLHVNIEEVERLIAAASFDLQIDREAEVIRFNVK